MRKVNLIGLLVVQAIACSSALTAKADFSQEYKEESQWKSQVSWERAQYQTSVKDVDIISGTQFTKAIRFQVTGDGTIYRLESKGKWVSKEGSLNETKKKYVGFGQLLTQYNQEDCKLYQYNKTLWNDGRTTLNRQVLGICR